MGKIKKKDKMIIQKKLKKKDITVNNKNKIINSKPKKLFKTVKKEIETQNLKQIIEDKNLVKKHDPSEIEQTLFIGNIPSNTKKSQLISLFSSFGTVKTIRFRTIDGKKLFKHKMRKDAESLNAYVVMNSKEALDKALTLSGTEFKGKHIRVTRVVKSTDDDDVDTKRIIFVGNLKYSATDEKLYEIFSSCGEIEYVRTIRNNNGCKGIAYVCFKKPDSIVLALELNNTLLDDRPIHVERYSKQKLETYKKKKTEEKDQNTGPVRRIKEKEKKLDKTKKKIANKVGDKKTENSKLNRKSEFRGAQVNKKKFKKKKGTNAVQALVKKIAPKSQIATTK